MQQPVPHPQKAISLQRRQCTHCNTPFAPLHAEDCFCCRGCEAVHELISTQGFGDFYSMRQGISAPAAVTPLEPQAVAALHLRQDEAQTQAAANGSSAPEAQLGIGGMHCVGCRWLIAQLFTRQSGHRTIEVNLDEASAFISWNEGFDLCAFAQTLNAYGYTLLPHPSPLEGGNSSQAQTPAQLRSQTRKRLLPRLLLCGVFALNAFLFSLPQLLANTNDGGAFAAARLFSLVVLLCATLALGLCVSWLFRRTQNRQTTVTPTPAAPVTSATPAAETPSATRLLSSLLRLTGYVLITLFLIALFGKSFGFENTIRVEAVSGLSFGVLLLLFLAAK